MKALPLRWYWERFRDNSEGQTGFWLWKRWRHERIRRGWVYSCLLVWVPGEAKYREENPEQYEGVPAR